MSPQCHCALSQPRPNRQLSVGRDNAPFYMMRAADPHADTVRRRPGGFDAFVLTGALVNLVVVAVLVIHWLVAA